MMTINHLHLKTRNLEESVKFYSLFGFKEKVRITKTLLFLQDEAGFDLALDQVDFVEELPKGVHFGFALKSRNDVESVLGLLKQSYPHLLSHNEIRDNGSWGDIELTDPDGYPIQIYWDVDLH